jgi:hypothetical protein
VDPVKSFTINLYGYCRCCPICSTDSNGKQSQRVEADLDLQVVNILDNWGVDDLAAGFGDNLSFELTAIFRETTGIDDSVDRNSVAYSTGGSAATVGQLAIAGGALRIAIRQVGARTVARRVVTGYAADRLATATLDAVDPSGAASGVYGVTTAYMIPTLRSPHASPRGARTRDYGSTSGSHRSRISSASSSTPESIASLSAASPLLAPSAQVVPSSQVLPHGPDLGPNPRNLPPRDPVTGQRDIDAWLGGLFRVRVRAGETADGITRELRRLYQRRAPIYGTIDGPRTTEPVVVGHVEGQAHVLTPAGGVAETAP